MPIIPAQELRHLNDLIEEALSIVVQYEPEVRAADQDFILEETRHFIDTIYRLESMLWHLGYLV